MAGSSEEDSVGRDFSIEPGGVVEEGLKLGGQVMAVGNEGDPFLIFVIGCSKGIPVDLEPPQSEE